MNPYNKAVKAMRMKVKGKSGRLANKKAKPQVKRDKMQIKSTVV